MYKFRFGEAARGVTFVPSYLDFGTFVRFYTTKKRLLSTDKRRFFECCLPCRANDVAFGNDIASLMMCAFGT